MTTPAADPHARYKTLGTHVESPIEAPQMILERAPSRTYWTLGFVDGGLLEDSSIEAYKK